MRDECVPHERNFCPSLRAANRASSSGFGHTMTKRDGESNPGPSMSLKKAVVVES